MKVWREPAQSSLLFFLWQGEIMAKKRLPNSIRKFICREKARIRAQVLDVKEQEKQIKKFYEKI